MLTQFIGGNNAFLGFLQGKARIAGIPARITRIA